MIDNPNAIIVNKADSNSAKIEAVKGIIRRYFETDPWTEEPNSEFDDSYTAQDAIDDIVAALGR